jgi:hypothetical protein
MLRIGVTGHRVLSNPDKIKAGIDLVLLKIHDSFPDQKWIIYSPLAQGADCMVAERILEQDQAELVVPLPLPASEYSLDFTNHYMRQIFEHLMQRANQIILMPPQSSRTEAYLAAGKYVLEHCDVLIAIWDGKAAHGIGGTGDIVRLAREKGLPLAWIHAGNRLPGTMEATVLEINQGSVSFERFSAR